jgi:hypothetical protein
VACQSYADHTTILTTTPLHVAALHLVAQAVGFHLYVNTTAAGRTRTTCNGDGIEATGAGLRVRAGVSAREWVPWEVTLPPSVAGWSVYDEAGEVVCRHCRTFACALAPGHAAAFVVEPENAA